MCGRFALGDLSGAFLRVFSLTSYPELMGSYNICPTNSVVGISQEGGQRRADLYKWGLVPRWAKDEKIGPRLINARGETVEQKPSFKSAFRKRRLLIAAEGFFEWKKTGKTKTPYYFRVGDGEIFAFAGLWETYKRPDDSILSSCTLITTTANELVSTVHHRMPVILPPSAWDQWLNPEIDDPAVLKPLLAPYPAADMNAHPVGHDVGDVRCKERRCIEPVVSLF
jgi:putative SOS response-associated peptidase YedK